MKRQHEKTVGEMVEVFYAEFLALYGDPELAQIATAATINDLVAASAQRAAERESAEARNADAA